ncbi:hypothetical protein V6Z11_A06G160900 [Gossypium hirsutum]
MLVEPQQTGIKVSEKLSNSTSRGELQINSLQANGEGGKLVIHRKAFF